MNVILFSVTEHTSCRHLCSLVTQRSFNSHKSVIIITVTRSMSALDRYMFHLNSMYENERRSEKKLDPMDEEKELKTMKK